MTFYLTKPVNIRNKTPKEIYGTFINDVTYLRRDGLTDLGLIEEENKIAIFIFEERDGGLEVKIAQFFVTSFREFFLVHIDTFYKYMDSKIVRSQV
jgi:hypothetical protein